MTASVRNHSQKMLRDRLPESLQARHKRVARSVALDASQIYGCRVEAVFVSNDHRALVVSARRYTIHKLRRLGWSMGAVAKSLGVDRSTVFYALSKPIPEVPWKPAGGPVPYPDESGIWAI